MSSQFPPFPDISLHLTARSPMHMAHNAYGGRHFAKVCLAMYDNIPAEQVEARNGFQQKVGWYLNEKAFYMAPELHRMWWGDLYMLTFGDDGVFTKYIVNETTPMWVERCGMIMADKLKIAEV